MNTEEFTMSTLFQQLGLDSSEAAIKKFLQLHSPLPQTQCLHKAAIWTSSQALFLQQAIAEDSEWSYLVDELNMLLR